MMLRILLLFALSIGSVWAVPGCTGLTLDEQGPYWLVYSWQVTGEAAYGARIKYGLSAVTENTQSDGLGNGVLAGNRVRMFIGGLTPSTTYQIEASASNDFVTYCTGLTTSQATAAAPPENEQNPAPPVLGDWNPHVVTARTGITRPITDCNNLHADGFNIAGPGDTITLPAGETCNANNINHAPSGYWHFNIDGRVGGWIGPFACTAATNRCVKTSHGISDGQEVFFGGQYNYPIPPNPINFGWPYYAKLIDADTLEFAETPGGATIDFTSTNNEILIATNRNCTAEVVVTTAGASTAFPPEGVRTNDTDWPMATLVMKNLPTGNDVGAFPLSFGGASCVRFVNIRIVWDNGATPGTTVDPEINSKAFKSRPYNHNITFDRVVFKAANDVQRPYGSVFDGYRMAFINSHVEGMRIWVPHYKAATAFTSTTASFTGDRTLHTGTSTPCTVNPSFQITAGTSTGSFYISDNGTCTDVRVDGPSGLTVNCTNCTYNGSNPTNFPLGGDSRYSRFNMSSGTITSGQITAHNHAEYQGFGGEGVGIGEASSGWLSMSWGPGPYWIENNYVKNSFGILFYSDGANADAVSSACTPITCPLKYLNPADFLFHRNHFYYDDAYVFSSPSWNLKGKWGGRNIVEWKRGLRVSVKGNIFDGNPVTNTNVSAPAITLTPLSETPQEYDARPYVHDVEVAYNTIRRTGMGIVITPQYPGGLTWGTLPTRRIKIHDNVIGTDARLNMNGTASNLFGSGEAIRQFGAPMVRFENNTITSLIGQAALLYNFAYYPTGGQVVRDNIFFLNNDDSYLGAKWSDSYQAHPTRDGWTAKKAFDAVWTPSYVMRANAIICGYSTSETLTELNQAACDALHDDADDWRDVSGTTWASGATVAARRTAAKFMNFDAGDFRLRYDSPFRGAGYATGQAGADQNAIDAAQGRVTGVSARLPAATTLDLSWTAPDSQSCWGEVLSNTGTFVARTQAAQTTRRQGVQFTGLSAATPYRWRVLCAAEQPTGRFMTK